MNTTTNLQFKKPASTEHVLVTDLNDNAQIIDDTVGAFSSLGANTNLVAEILKRAKKVTVVNNGDLAALDSNGDLTDSGKKATDFASRVSGATNGNFAALDANGNLTDSGKKTSDFILASTIATTTETQAIINEYTELSA